jgi:hypothetical protein
LSGPKNERRPFLHGVDVGIIGGMDHRTHGAEMFKDEGDFYL